MPYRLKTTVKEDKQTKHGYDWETGRRYYYLNRIKGNLKNSVSTINDVLTFKECEIIFRLPTNTCVQDYKNEVMRHTHARKSANTYIITKKEAIRLYSEYWTKRAKKNEGHLYTSYDGKKMTETEFLIRFGNDYEYYE